MIKKIYIISVLITPLLIVISLIGNYNHLLSGSVVFLLWSIGGLLGMSLRNSLCIIDEKHSFVTKARKLLLFAIAIYSLLAILLIIIFTYDINPFMTDNPTNITNIQTLIFSLIVIVISIAGLLLLRKKVAALGKIDTERWKNE